MRFVSTEPEGAELEAAMFDEHGAPMGEKHYSRVTWEELEGHASYPRSCTIIEEEELETPLGTFACWRYTVTVNKEAREEVTRVWFARALPGAPILHEVAVEGVVVTRMELVVHTCGTPVSTP